MSSRSPERMSTANRPFEVAHCLLTSEGEEVLEEEERGWDGKAGTNGKVSKKDRRGSDGERNDDRGEKVQKSCCHCC